MTKTTFQLYKKGVLYAALAAGALLSSAVFAAGEDETFATLITKDEGWLATLIAFRWLIVAVFALIGLYFVGAGVIMGINGQKNPQQDPNSTTKVLSHIIGGAVLVIIPIVVGIAVGSFLGDTEENAAGIGGESFFTDPTAGGGG